MKKFLAFTLAETLIVMGVIGIVSALTLPNLNSSTGDKEKVAKVKKIYQNLTDAVGRAEAVYGPIDEWFINDTTDEAKAKRAGERITEFMKTSKVCAMAANQGCFTSGSSKVSNGGSSGNTHDSNTGTYKIITADGTSLSIDVNVGNLLITVDIDGPTKGSYTYSKDLFQFQTNSSYNICPSGYDKTFAQLLSEIPDRGAHAAAWIMNYDNADYLQIQSVSGSTATCKNGNTMTESHPRCK